MFFEKLYSAGKIDVLNYPQCSGCKGDSRPYQSYNNRQTDENNDKRGDKKSCLNS